MSEKQPKKASKKRKASAAVPPPPPVPSQFQRTLGHAMVSMRECAYTLAGCAAIAAVLMLAHLRPFG